MAARLVSSVQTHASRIMASGAASSTSACRVAAVRSMSQDCKAAGQWRCPSSRWRSHSAPMASSCSAARSALMDRLDGEGGSGSGAVGGAGGAGVSDGGGGAVCGAGVSDGGGGAVGGAGVTDENLGTGGAAGPELEPAAVASVAVEGGCGVEGADADNWDDEDVCARGGGAGVVV